MDDTALPDSIDIDSIGTEPVQGRKLATSGKRTLGGRPAFDGKKQAVFAAQPIEKKAEVLKRQWANIAYILLCQGERFAQSVTKKDYGRLMQLLSSAGIAYDKVVPKGEIPGSLTFNLFNGLDKSKLAQVLGQAQSSQPVEQPVVDITPSSVLQPQWAFTSVHYVDNQQKPLGTGPQVGTPPLGMGVSYGSYGSQVNSDTYRAYNSVWKKISKNPKRIERLGDMVGLDITVGLERIVLKLPIGYTVDKATHKKLDSPNTIGQQELFTITIKEHGWPT